MLSELTDAYIPFVLVHGQQVVYNCELPTKDVKPGLSLAPRWPVKIQQSNLTEPAPEQIHLDDPPKTWRGRALRPACEQRVGTCATCWTSTAGQGFRENPLRENVSVNDSASTAEPHRLAVLGSTSLGVLNAPC